jgi:hypothetical protein
LQFPSDDKEAKAMPSNNQSPTSTFHAILLITVITLVVAVVPAWAQNAVPPTARQAATQSAFAHRLTPPAVRQTPRPAAAVGRFRRHPAWPLDGVAYDNGPVNGQVDAWTINFGFTTTDSIQLNATASGIQFWAWLVPGDTITNVEVQIGANAFGNELFDGIVTLTQSNCFTNDLGYSVCLETGNFTGPALSGNAWLTLANANVPDGDPVFWDENSGVGCDSPGCPSQAQENTIGTIPSEAFTLTGAATTTTWCWQSSQPSATEPAQPRSLKQDPARKQAAQAQSFQVIYNFLGGQQGISPIGLTIDKNGNFYGTTAGGGNTQGSCGAGGCGTVFKLWHQGSSWMLNTIYQFLGPDNEDGAGPSATVVIGPDGTLYGATSAGGFTGNNCGSGGCGTVYNLRPPATPCRTAVCPWTETLIHTFTGWTSNAPGSQACSLRSSFSRLTRPSLNFPDIPGDGAQPIGAIAFEPTGSLFGVTEYGPQWSGNCVCRNDTWGSCGGLIYSLTPSNSGWQETIVHAFGTFGDDGSLPTGGVSVDNYGGAANTTTLYSVNWQNGGLGTVYLNGYVHDFPQNGSQGSGPFGLIIDQRGNIFVTAAPGCGNNGGTVVLENYNQIYSFSNVDGSPEIIDASGNLYGTTWGPGTNGSIFKLSPDNGGWTYTDLYDFTGGADGAGPWGLVLDASGNIWGVTSSGGANGYGVVFEITP